ncbi:MAG TPA: ATP-binding cassette domain-containing protein [Terrabacter sp.]|nr:ATP-binding cassette domain-containing protein [Terrabacter sp.]
MATLSFQQLTKRYGDVVALDRFTAVAMPGRITAFVGPNGAGKSTSMRILLGLAEPTSGTATIDKLAYRDLPYPTRVVGAVLDQGFHPNRSALNHVRIAARQAGVSPAGAAEVLDRFGLTSAARRRVGGFSLGMRQRLALASAVIAAPSVLVLDEPLNGLDPDGIRGMRHYLRSFADSGGTVLLSSHLLSEVQAVADDLIVIAGGRLAAAGPMDELVGDADLESLFQSVTQPTTSQGTWS